MVAGKKRNTYPDTHTPTDEASRARRILLELWHKAHAMNEAYEYGYAEGFQAARAKSPIILSSTTRCCKLRNGRTARATAIVRSRRKKSSQRKARLLTMMRLLFTSPSTSSLFQRRHGVSRVDVPELREIAGTFDDIIASYVIAEYSRQLTNLDVAVHDAVEILLRG